MTITPLPLFPTVAVHHDSPIGRLQIHARAGFISRLDIETPEQSHGVRPEPGSDDLLDEARRQLDDYFARRRLGFDLPLDPVGTPFQEDVWAELEKIPWGTATSYADLAQATGRPLGARAVGGAIRANRIALLVPCHRVLGAGRRLTGYTPGQGIVTKRWLLDHEGIDYVA